MDSLKHWLLTILILLPMAGALLVLFMRTRDGVRWAALGTTLLTFILSMLLLLAVSYGVVVGSLGALIGWRFTADRSSRNWRLN